MRQFFLGDRRQGSHQLCAGGIAEDQVQGDARRFAFAVGVIEQDRVEVVDRLLDPG